MLSASDEAEQLVASVLHRFTVVGLHVQAEERLGVGRAEVEPPVAQVDSEAVEVVYLYDFLLGVVVLDVLERSGLVFYFGVDLTRADVGVDGGEEGGDGLTLAADELGDG